MKRAQLVKHHQQSIAEIKGEIAKLEIGLIEARMKQKLGQLKNVRSYKMLRHDIARLKSIISIKELSEAVTVAVSKAE